MFDIKGEKNPHFNKVEEKNPEYAGFRNIISNELAVIIIFVFIHDAFLYRSALFVYHEQGNMDLISFKNEPLEPIYPNNLPSIGNCGRLEQQV